MARRIYLVELEIEADDEANLPLLDDAVPSVMGTIPEDEQILTVMLLKATAARTTRLGLLYYVDAAQVIGTREG